jgi:head-tail adaptor
MRETAESALPDEMTILTKTLGPGKASGGAEEFVPSASVRCRVSPLDAKEAANWGIEWSTGAIALSYPGGTDIQTTSRLRIRDIDYEVQAVAEPRAWTITGRCAAVRVRKKIP